ncbi:unnamed protein product, partial [Prorocentrum cordatum]
MGAVPEDPAFSLSRILESEVEVALDAWEIQAGEGDARGAKAAEKSKAHQALERARGLAAGPPPTAESRALTAEQIIDLAVKVSRAAAAASSGMVKVSSYVGQVSVQEVPILRNEDIQAHCQAHKNVFKRLPPPWKECACEQLSCLFAKLESKCAPCADFAVSCPFGQRFQKRLKMKGLALHASEEFKPLKLYGPSTFQEWGSCCELRIAGLVGFRAVELGNLLECQSVIKGFHELYGASFWPLIYRAESRMRAEQMERPRRGVEEKWAKAWEGGFPTMVDFDPGKPWGAAWKAACDDDRWWKKELDDAAEDVLTRSSRQPGAKKLRAHNVVDGLFAANRSEELMCKGWQDGTCAESLGKWRSKNWGQVHQCANYSDTMRGAHYPNTCQGTLGPPAAPVKRAGVANGKAQAKARAAEADPNIESGRSALGPAAAPRGPDLRVPLGPAGLARGQPPDRRAPQTVASIAPCANGFDARVLEMGFETGGRGALLDSVFGDLAGEFAWKDIVAKICQKHCRAARFSPPSTTFGAFQQGGEARGGEFRPPRGPGSARIYGVPHLWVSEKERVKIEALLARRCAEVAALGELEGAFTKKLVQCEPGAATARPISLK